MFCLLFDHMNDHSQQTKLSNELVMKKIHKYEQGIIKFLNKRGFYNIDKIFNVENILPIHNLFNNVSINENKIYDMCINENNYDDELVLYHGIYFEIKYDYDKAIKLYEIGVDKGNSRAMVYLGGIYENFNKRDYKKAINLYEMAVNKNNSDAMNDLGCMYKHGRGTKKDYTKTVELYNMAIDLGNTNAMNNLALMYKYGKGVNADLEKEIELFEMASNKNNVTAMQNAFASHMEKCNYNLAAKYYALYCKTTDCYWNTNSINFDQHNIIWETYLHEFWPNKNVKNNIFLLLSISKYRKNSKIDIGWMIKGITLIIIKYLTIFDK